MKKKILRDIADIKASNIPIRYILIDDGHIEHTDKKLTSLIPDPKRFPHEWKAIMAEKDSTLIKWIGAWYALSGYWEGIAPHNKFPQSIQKTFIEHNGRTVPGKDRSSIENYYNYFVKQVKSQGMDFLKIDNQSFTLPIYMGTDTPIEYAKACNMALEKATHAQGVGLINCMAQNTINTDNIYYSNVARVSIDYEKYNETKAKSHLFQSYTNTLLQEQCAWPDHDMFHSCDSICGDIMARSKAVSGGPIYLSDSPKDFNPQYIWPLIDEKGKIFRPLTPAVPTPESIFRNPLLDGKAYRVFCKMNRNALSFIYYNLSHENKTIKTSISPEDYYGLSRTPSKTKLIVYNWKTNHIEEFNKPQEVLLNGFTDELFHIYPVEQGWGVIGIKEKYLSPQTVEVLTCTNQTLELNVLTKGTLYIWIEHENHKKELKQIIVDNPRKITLHK